MNIYLKWVKSINKIKIKIKIKEIENKTKFK